MASHDQPGQRSAHAPHGSRCQTCPGQPRAIRALVNRRLLLSDARNGEAVVEVAHESLLRQWLTLAEWLRTEREDLKEADRLEQAATAWTKSGKKADWLIEGERLVIAEALAAKSSYRRRLEPASEFLLASRQKQQQRREEEERRAPAELDAAKESKLPRKRLPPSSSVRLCRHEADARGYRARQTVLALIFGRRWLR